MEILMWLFILVYILGVGLFAVAKLDDFIRRNPRAFPGNRRIVTVPLPQNDPFGDDGTCDLIPFEELESHE